MPDTKTKIVKYGGGVVIAAVIILIVFLVIRGGLPWGGSKAVDAAREEASQSEDTQAASTVTTGEDGMIDLSGDSAMSEEGQPLEGTAIVPFGDAEMTIPDGFNVETAKSIATISTDFTKGLWDRPASDKTQFDSFIRMWDKYGCAESKGAIISDLKNMPPPEMKPWEGEDGRVQAVTGNVLITADADENGEVYLMDVVVSFMVTPADDPDTSIFENRFYDQYGIANVDGKPCVAAMSGASWDWAAPPADDDAPQE